LEKGAAVEGSTRYSSAGNQKYEALLTSVTPSIFSRTCRKCCIFRMCERSTRRGPSRASFS